MHITNRSLKFQIWGKRKWGLRKTESYQSSTSCCKHQRAGNTPNKLSRRAKLNGSDKRFAYKGPCPLFFLSVIYKPCLLFPHPSPRMNSLALKFFIKNDLTFGRSSGSLVPLQRAQSLNRSAVLVAANRQRKMAPSLPGPCSRVDFERRQWWADPVVCRSAAPHASSSSPPNFVWGRGKGSWIGNG